MKLVYSVADPVLLDFPDTFESSRLIIRAPRPGDGRRLHEAVAESIEQLEVALSAIGLTLDQVAIDQAGIEQKIEYLGWTTTSALLGHWIECVLPPDEQRPNTTSNQPHEA